MGLWFFLWIRCFNQKLVYFLYQLNNLMAILSFVRIFKIDIFLKILYKTRVYLLRLLKSWIVRYWRDLVVVAILGTFRLKTRRGIEHFALMSLLKIWWVIVPPIVGKRIVLWYWRSVEICWVVGAVFTAFVYASQRQNWWLLLISFIFSFLKFLAHWL